MISVSASVSKASIDRVKAMIERKITERQEQVALKVYNFIVSAEIDYNESPNFGSPARTPFWSGAFAASWEIQSGSPSSEYKTAPARNAKHPTTFERATEKFNLQHASYKVPIYITNRVKDDKGVGYAGKIENIGTPCHEEPWKIAANAANVIKHMMVY